MDESVFETQFNEFSKIKWTDLALIAIRTKRQDNVDDLILDVVGLYWEIGVKFELCFEDTTFLHLSIDFASKRSCSDAFDGAACHSGSVWKTSLIQSNPHDDFSSYLHFEMGLVPKGGKIDLLARSFTFRRL